MIDSVCLAVMCEDAAVEMEQDAGDEDRPERAGEALRAWRTRRNLADKCSKWFEQGAHRLWRWVLF